MDTEVPSTQMLSAKEDADRVALKLNKWVKCPHCGRPCPRRVTVSSGVQLAACSHCRGVYRLFIDGRQVQYVQALPWDPERHDFPTLAELYEEYPDESQYLETAFHEAGHAVVHYGLGACIERVVLRGTPDRQNRLGYLDHGRSFESELALCNPAARIIGLMAGAKAVSVAMNDFLMPDGRDAACIEHFLWSALVVPFEVLRRAQGGTGATTSTPIPDEWLDAYYEKLDAVVWRIFVRRKRSWRAVKAVVKALLVNPTIEGDEAFRSIVRPTGFRRRSLRKILDSKDVQPDIPDPDGVLAEWRAAREAELAAWKERFRAYRQSHG